MSQVRLLLFFSNSMFSWILFRIFFIHLFRVQQSLTFTFNLYSHSCVVVSIQGTEIFQRWKRIQINFPTVLTKLWQKIRRYNRKLKSDGSFRPLFDLDTCSRDFFSHILLFFFSPFIISIKFFLIFIKYIMSIIDQRGTKMTSYTHLLGACNTLEHYII